jgi:16S rRNA C1402 N4-methylase RsmH
MRMDPQTEPAAEQVVNHMDEPTLAQAIYEFGEERRSRRSPEPLFGRGRYGARRILRES